MWVLKTHGESFYVNHVNCSIEWSTKETPANSHTKGSIKVKECLLQIDDDNCATLSKLTLLDKIRLRNQRLGITRVIMSDRRNGNRLLVEALKNQNVKHGPIKCIGGACTTPFYITDILDKKYMPLLAMALSETNFRVLMPNEAYYKIYDDPKYANIDNIDSDYFDKDEDDKEDE